MLAKALPGHGAAGAERATDRFEGVMKVSVGPVTAAEFDVTVTLQRQSPPERFAMQIDGKGGVGYHARHRVGRCCQEQPDGDTLMHYTSDVQVGGRIAAVGQRLLESWAR